MYRFIFLWLTFLTCSTLFADCENGECFTCQSCFDQIMNCATNGNGNCSSCTNCVQFSPSECSNFVSSARLRLSSIQSKADNIINDCSDLNQILDNNLLSSIDSAITNINNALNSISSFNPSNDVVTLLANSLHEVNVIIGRYSQVDQDGPPVAYINLLTGVKVQYKSLSDLVTPRLRTATNYIYQAIDSYGQVESDIINTHNLVGEYLSNAISNLNNLKDEIEYCKRYLKNINSETYSIRQEINSLEREVGAINCEPCSRGSSSGGGGGGGGGGSGGIIDFTPLEQAIHDLHYMVEYELKRLYNLLNRYYTDYNAAADNKPSYGSNYYGTGASANNWFMRVEQLLAMISDPSKIGNDTVGEDGPTSPPEPLESTERVEQLESKSVSGETDSDTEKAALNNSLENGWDRVKSAFVRFYNSLRGIGRVETNIDGHSLELTFTVDGQEKSVFSVPQGTSARLSIVRSAFNLVWLIMCAFLYIFSFKLFLSLILHYIAWFLKLASATFGS